MVSVSTDLRTRDVCFSIEKDTNQETRKVLVEQNAYELKVFLLEQGGKKEVDKHLILGLPKESFLPREFFISSRVKIKSDGFQIEFLGRLFGGMERDKNVSEKPTTSATPNCNTKTTVEVSGGISRDGAQGSVKVERSFEDCGRTTCKTSGSYQSDDKGAKKA